MVQRKLFADKPVKVRKERIQKISSKKYDLEKLPDCVVDGKICVTENSSCIISRWGRELHNCTYLKLDAKFNVMEFWDDTVQHMYSVSLNEPLPTTFKIVKMAGTKAQNSLPTIPEVVTEISLNDTEQAAVEIQEVLESEGAILSDGTILVEANDIDHINFDINEEVATLSADNSSAIEQQ